MITTKKSDGSPNNILRVLGFFKELKWRVLLVIIIGSGSIVMAAFIPTYLRGAFDVLRSWIDPNNSAEWIMSEVVHILLIFGVLTLLNALFDIFCIFTILKYEGKIVSRKLLEIKKKLDVVPTDFLEEFTVGDLSRRVANLVNDTVRLVLQTVYNVARISFFFITTSIVMFTLNWVLALVVILSLPLCILTARFVAKRTQKFFNAYAKQSADFYGYVDQKFTLKSLYDMHGINDDSKFINMNDNQTRTMIGETTATAFNTVYINFIQNFMLLLVTLLFGILYITQPMEVKFGLLPAFAIFSSRFLANAVVVSDVTTVLQGINSRAHRIFEILDAPVDVTEKEHIEIQQIKNEIVFKNVSLVKGNQILLDTVSFKIPQGQSVAFVGPTGCGKSRIVDMLAKLIIPTEGQITVDGVNLEEIYSRSYYKCMGLALERPFIFRGTVAENLLYGIRRALPENVMEITNHLGSHDFIESLDSGYETQLSENASNLSNSQKQAIGVARLVLQSCDVAIFNESLSAADTITEKTVFEKIMELDKDQTTIFVTHRLSSVEKCDIIYYMEKGRIVEKGTHAELMAKKKRYYQTYTGN